MIQKEKRLPESKRMDFVAIVTPNHMHFPPAKMALENGFHVVCDKPLCFNMKEALALQKLVEGAGPCSLGARGSRLPIVSRTRAMVKDGDIRLIRKSVVEYPRDG